MSIQRQCPGVHGSFLFLQKSAAILDAVPVNEFFGTKFLFFFMHAPVIHFPVSFGVRLRAAGVRGQRTKRWLSSLARQTASQSSDQTAQSETRCLPAFKTWRRSDFAHRSAKRDTKAVENVRLSANIRGALSNLKKTGIIADGRGMRVRKMKFCDRIRWQELHPICQTFPTHKKRTVYAAHLPQDVTQFFFVILNV